MTFSLLHSLTTFEENLDSLKPNDIGGLDKKEWTQ